MESTALVRVIQGRPSTVVKDGAVVYVCIHDAYHLRERNAWKRRLAVRHPDAPGPTDRQAFRRKRAAYRDWLANESRWYRELGLEAPAATGPRKALKAPAVQAACRICNRPFTPKKAQPSQPAPVTCGKVCGSRLRAQRRREQRG